VQGLQGIATLFLFLLAHELNREQSINGQKKYPFKLQHKEQNSTLPGENRN
jgi:hypothetical protein